MPTLIIANNSDDLRAALADIRPDALVLNVDPDTLADLLKTDSSDNQQRTIRRHLVELGISQTRKGFQFLCIGVSLFLRDPDQLFSKELYPAIAKAVGYGNAAQIERAIRSLIIDAWKTRNPEIWYQYFPNYKNAPTNKQFITTLAHLLA